MMSLSAPRSAPTGVARARAMTIVLAIVSGLAAPGFCAEWTVLRPDELVSEGGAMLRILEDGSILAEGENAPKDAYLLTLDTELSGITAFRLEVLPDERLPKNGPGRAGQGNFVLSNLTVRAGERRARGLKEVRFHGASASFSQDVKHVSGMIDGGLSSGWSIFPQMGKPNEAVIQCNTPIAFKRGSRLQFRMDFQFGGSHNLGRFRLSATTEKGPIRAPGAPEPDPWHEFQPKIDLAIDRGVDLLLDQQELDGSWSAHQDGYRTGATGLALYTLLKSGVAKDHPSVRRAAAFIRTHPSVKTYETACCLMALTELGRADDEDKIQELGDSLVSWQRPDGGYSYPDGSIDLSNIQYAALGLRAAAHAGVKIEGKVWERLVEIVGKHQELVKNPYGPAGFSYRPGEIATGSMTAAGISVLAICGQEYPRLRSKTQQRIDQGLVWLGEHFSPRQNPTAKEDRADNRHYYLYGVERVGGLTGKDLFGVHNWYREGARFLVEDQKEKGDWDGAQPQTCFALLFLNRATASATGTTPVAGSRNYGGDDPAQDVNLRAAGDTPLAVWISSFGASTLADMSFEADEGDGPRVVKVEYFMLGHDPAGGDGADEPIKLAEVKGDPTRSSGTDRYPASLSFRGNGRYRVYAEVTVLDPLAADDDVDDDKRIVLSSDPIVVVVREAKDPKLVRYASDAGRNEMATSLVLPRASSELNESHQAAFATDNLQSKGWCSADNDPTPSLTIDLERPARADTIVFSHHGTGDDQRTARPAKVRVELNGTFRFELEIDPDPTRKTEYKFGKAARVQRISILVLEQTGATSDKRGVGFGEVELHDSKRVERDMRKNR